MDTPQLLIDDASALYAAAMRARAQGFAGKLCIHPGQIGIINQVFSATAAEIASATRVVAAFAEAEAKGIAALTVYGEMVDYPVVERARQILAMTSQPTS